MVALERKVRKMLTCTHVEEVWGPHPGCREFMDGPEHVEGKPYCYWLLLEDRELAWKCGVNSEMGRLI